MKVLRKQGAALKRVHPKRSIKRRQKLKISRTKYVDFEFLNALMQIIQISDLLKYELIIRLLIKICSSDKKCRIYFYFSTIFVNREVFCSSERVLSDG